MSRYGCYNRAPFRESMPVQNGWVNSPNATTRLPRMQPSPFRMARECQFTLTELGQTDPKCDGCKWKAKNA
jgi:hypothetical protein